MKKIQQCSNCKYTNDCTTKKDIQNSIYIKCNLYEPDGKGDYLIEPRILV